MTTSEDNITSLVKDTNRLMALANAQPSAPINTLAGHTTDLAELAPAAAAITTNAENIAAIQAVEGHADNAEAARDAAQTAAQQVVTNSGVPPILANAVRAEYKIAGRAPSVIIDPVRDVYFGPDKPMPLSSLVDFSRNSPTTQIDRNGSLQTLADNIPRDGHHVHREGMFLRAGLRMDPQATNLILDSEDFTTPKWRYINGAVTSNTGDYPLDGVPGYLLTAPVGGSNCFVWQYITVNAGRTVVSGYLKQGSTQFAQIRVQEFDTGTNMAWFDLQNGTTGQLDDGLVASGITPVGAKGWYRCWAVFETINDLHGRILFGPSTADGQPGIDAGDTVGIAGVQVEAGNTPTSYIKTEGSAVTRAKDTLSIPATNLPSTSGEYTFLLEGYIDWPDADQSLKYLTFWDQALGPRYAYLIIRGEGAYKSRFEAVHYDGNIMSGASSPYETFSPGMKVEIKAAVSFSGAGTKMAVNGALFGPGVGPDSILPLTDGKLVLVDGIPFSLTKFRVFDSALSNAALTGATAL